MTNPLKNANPLRIKLAADTATAGAFSGYGAIFGNVDSYGDIIEPGAFSATLAQHRAAKTAPLLLWQHKTDTPIGRWTDLIEDGTGLFVTGQLNLKTVGGQTAWAHLEAGDIDGLSIGYREVRARADGAFRRLEAVELVEVSIVSIPANGQARIQLGSKRELENILTKAGLARSAAARIAAVGWPALSQTDQGSEDETAIKAIADLINASTKKIKEL